MKTGAQIICETLLDLGVEYIFGYNGGAILPFYDTLTSYPKLKHIMVRHEQAAAFAAQGIARATGKLGVCVSTSGPGAMNLVTGIADAQMDSVPIMAITGQVATKYIGTDAFQESDVIGVMAPITKHNIMAEDITKLRKNIIELSNIALFGRQGPVHIDIPKDVQLNSIEKTDNLLPTFYNNFPTIDTNEIQNAIDEIAKAKRPVILIGHGIIASGAKDEAQDFIKNSSIPFSSTLHGLSALVEKYPYQHELNLGMMGMHGTVTANWAIKNADLIISLGMRFDDRVTGKLETYAKDAKVIHIDIDKSELHKNVKSHIPIHGDLKQVLDKLANLVKNFENSKWLEQIYSNEKEWKEIEQNFLSKGTGPNNKLLMSYVIHTLSNLTHGKDLIVSDVGQHQMFAARYYNFQEYNSWFCSGGAGTMGFALPTSIGVQLARQNKTVWCIVGDGGFQMNIQELITLSNENIPIKILLLNNQFLGMVKQWQSLFHNGNFSSTPLKNPNFEYIAKGNNIDYVKVTKKEDLEEGISKAKNSSGPFLLEVMTDMQEFVFPMIPTGADLSEIRIK